MRIELIEQASPELREAVHSVLRTFNRQANPAWYAARALPENEPRPLNLFAFDNLGQARGGLFGETQFLWLKVSILAVHADFRQQGLGRRLMQQAEAIASERGCRFAYVDTMETQAPTFYEKLGYQIAGRLDNWDSHGHAKFFLTKTLRLPP
jgi:GNAT superfamily N-acetyltransferase